MGRCRSRWSPDPPTPPRRASCWSGYAGRARREPLLVVPTAADVEHYRRELAGDGRRVRRRGRALRLAGREIARPRRGARARRSARWRASRVAARRASARVRRSPASPRRPPRRASPRARGALRRARALRVDPARVHPGAARAGRPAPTGRAAYADELARAVRGLPRARSSGSGARRRELRALAALDALRARPARWGATPGVPLRLRRPHAAAARRGRDARRPRRRRRLRRAAPTSRAAPRSPGARATVEDLRAARAPSRVELRGRSRRTTRRRRARRCTTSSARLFEPGGAAPAAARGGARCGCSRPAASAPRPSSSRAEVLRLLREGGAGRGDRGRRCAPPARTRRCSTEVFGAATASRSRCAGAVPPAHTALGRGVLGAAALRAARRRRAADLLAWLRTPGLLEQPGAGRRARGRRRAATGAVTAADARRAVGGARDWPLEAIDRAARGRGAAGPAALLRRARGARRRRLFAAPHRRRAPRARPRAERRRRRALAGALRGALAELARARRRDPRSRPRPPSSTALLDGARRCSTRRRRRRAGARAASPTRSRIRARRFARCSCAACRRASSRAGPRPSRSSPTTSARALARASGLRLPRTRTCSAAERYLFYAARLAPEELLVLCWRSADEEGDPRSARCSSTTSASCSPTSCSSACARAPLGAVAWAPGAPTARERRARRGGRRPRREPPPLALAGARARRRAAPRASGRGRPAALEAWARCPVAGSSSAACSPSSSSPTPSRWPRLLRPRGAASGRSALRRAGGRCAPRAPARAPSAARRARSSEAERTGLGRTASGCAAALRAARGRPVRYLRARGGRAAALRAGALRAALRRRRGRRAPAVPLRRRPLRLRGAIDRVDARRRRRGAHRARLQGRRRATGRGAAGRQDGQLQVALYMLARAASCSGCEPVGGLYQPLRRARTCAPRGLVREDADPATASSSTTDRRSTPRSSRRALDARRRAAALRSCGSAAARAATSSRARRRCCGAAAAARYPAICRLRTVSAERTAGSPPSSARRSQRRSGAAAARRQRRLGQDRR